jgi:hypothetical protein
MQTTNLDPTLKRIGGKLREATIGVVEAPLTSRMTDLLAQLGVPTPAERLHPAGNEVLDTAAVRHSTSGDIQVAGSGLRHTC